MMENIHSEYSTPNRSYLNNGKFKKRFESLRTDIQKFISASNLEGKAVLNSIMLGYALVDYFEDIERLKAFHDVPHVNSIKIISYTSYWLLKRKPIQATTEDKNLVYVNERFVLAYILDSLSLDKGNLLLRDNVGIKSFIESLFYFLKFRQLTPHFLEMILISFYAGRIYQETDYDLSPSLSKYDEKN